MPLLDNIASIFCLLSTIIYPAFCFFGEITAAALSLHVYLVFCYLHLPDCESPEGWFSSCFVHCYIPRA